MLGRAAACRRTAKHTEPHDTDLAFPGAGREGEGPASRPLPTLEQIEPAMMAQDRQQDVVGHGRGQRRIDHARQRQIGQGPVLEQPVDAGA